MNQEVTVSKEKYAEYVEMETRIKVLKAFCENEKYIDTKDIGKIFGFGQEWNLNIPDELLLLNNNDLK